MRLQAKVAMLHEVTEAQRCKHIAGKMSVHIIADRPNKLSDLRAMLEPRFRVSCALLEDASSAGEGFDAVIIAVDLRKVRNIAPLKEAGHTIRKARTRLFLIDQKTNLLVAQSYALGATRVLFNPVTERGLLAQLADRPLGGPWAQAASETQAAAAMGAVTLTGMFSAVLEGRPVDVTATQAAGATIADSIANDGLSDWLENVRRHHEGTYQHCLLVTGIAVDFGLSLGLARRDIQRLYSAAMFHDIGKAVIPVALLDKPGRLDPRERALVETHPAAGYDALKGSAGISLEVLDAVRHHHEYLDGSGYPDALSGAGITDMVRVLTIADIFAALIERRGYRQAMSREKAYEIIRGMHGKLEAPLVAAFREVALSR
jgi:HD-GYP domain-containing protein (c-di-GMP phosphodiesterase class II)